MTPAEMDKAVSRARVSLESHSLDCDCGWCSVARALLAAVGERDAASHHVDEARQERDHMFVGAAELRAERDALSARLNTANAERDTATARAVAAEQRAEELQARYSRVMWGPVLDADVKQAVADEERARVVEAIAAWLDSIGGFSAALRDPSDLADHLRSQNWAPPEEESNG